MSIQSQLPWPDQIGIIPTAQSFMWASPVYSQQLTDTVNRLFYEFAAKYGAQTRWSYGPENQSEKWFDRLYCGVFECAAKYLDRGQGEWLFGPQSERKVKRDTVGRVGMHAEVQNSQPQAIGMNQGAFDSHDLVCQFGPKESDTKCSFSILKNCTREIQNQRLNCRSSTLSDPIAFDLTNPNVTVPGFQEDPVLSQTFDATEWWGPSDATPTNLTIHSYFQILADSFRSHDLTCSNQYPVAHFCLPPMQRSRLEQNFVNFLRPRLGFTDRGHFEYSKIDGSSLIKQNSFTSLGLKFVQNGFLPNKTIEGQLVESIDCTSFVPSPQNVAYCRSQAYFAPSDGSEVITVYSGLDPDLGAGIVSQTSPILLWKSLADPSNPSKTVTDSQPAQAPSGSPGGTTQGTNAQASGAASSGTPNRSGASRFKRAALGVGALAAIAIAYKALRKKEDASKKRLPKSKISQIAKEFFISSKKIFTPIFSKIS